MGQSSRTSSGIYHRISFFSDDFPFSIQRELDLPADFNESKRFKREFWKIVCVFGGHGDVLVNDTHHPIGAGSIFLVHPDDSTSFRIESEALDIYNILFMPDLLREELRELQDDFDFFSVMRRGGRDGGDRFRITRSDPEMRRLVRTLEREFDRMEQNYRLRIRLLLVELLILLARKAAGKVRRQSAGELTGYINHLIESYFREPFELDAVARKTGIDKSRLCRLYRAGSGLTIMEALRLRRLKEAAELLTGTEQSISEICFESGFKDLSYFYRSFTAHFGQGPGEYRRQRA